MKFRSLLTLWTLGCLAATGALSMEPEGGISLQGHLNTSRVPHRGGTVFLHLAVDATGFTLPDRSYEPMNVAVVLDRSGSMADERKLDYAKKALYALVDRLSSADVLTIVIYDDRIETLLPSQRVVDRDRIKRLIRSVHPRGSTNLGGGLQEGLYQISRNFRRGSTNRVILVSDGLANVGVTDPGELNRMVEKYSRKAISVTSIGVGLDYNENLMLGLAQHGGGNYYFVESPKQLASIFERELHDLRYIVAQNARIELSLGSGVQLVDVIGSECGRDDGRIVISLGDLSAGDRREMTVELTVPEGTGTLRVARGELRSDQGAVSDGGFATEIRYSDDAAELLRGKDWDVQPKVDIAISTRKVERAMQALDEGRTEDAGKEISEAAAELGASSALVNSPAAAPLIQSQIKRLNEYSRQMASPSVDARKVKKSVQYDNYEVQTKKKP